MCHSHTRYRCITGCMHGRLRPRRSLEFRRHSTRPFYCLSFVPTLSATLNMVLRYRITPLYPPHIVKEFECLWPIRSSLRGNPIEKVFRTCRVGCGVFACNHPSVLRTEPRWTTNSETVLRSDCESIHIFSVASPLWRVAKLGHEFHGLAQYGNLSSGQWLRQ